MSHTLLAWSSSPCAIILRRGLRRRGRTPPGVAPSSPCAAARAGHSVARADLLVASPSGLSLQLPHRPAVTLAAMLGPTARAGQPRGRRPAPSLSNCSCMRGKRRRERERERPEEIRESNCERRRGGGVQETSIQPTNGRAPFLKRGALMWQVCFFVELKTNSSVAKLAKVKKLETSKFYISLRSITLVENVLTSKVI